jgi:hypothetical protein
MRLLAEGGLEWWGLIFTVNYFGWIQAHDLAV